MIHSSFSCQFSLKQKLQLKLFKKILNMIFKAKLQEKKFKVGFFLSTATEWSRRKW